MAKLLGKRHDVRPKIDYIVDVKPSKSDWILKVCIVRLWRLHQYQNPNNTWSIEMVLQDEKGGRIQASISNTMLYQFEGKMNELQIYHMKNFVVLPNNLRQRATTHEFRLTFYKQTTITPTNDPSFEMNIFYFRPFITLSGDEEINEKYLFDVIGEIVSHDEVRNAPNGKDSIYMNIELEDDERNKLSATLWGDFVKQVTPYLKNPTEPVVIVMQLIQANKFQNKFSVRNTWNVSKLWIDEKLPQIIDFKTRLLSDGRSNSERISQISSERTYSILEELASSAIHIPKIEELTTNKEGTYWIIVELLNVEFDNGWSYLACKTKNCSKKVHKVGNIFYCTDCGESKNNHNYSYKLQVVATDGSGLIRLLLWDREANQLIGKTANEVAKSCVGSVEESNPLELDSIVLGKKALFKVVVESSNLSNIRRPYKVKRISMDEDLIKQYDYFANQDSLMYSSLHVDVAPHDNKEYKDSVSEDEVNSPARMNIKRIVDVDQDPTTQHSSSKVRRVLIKEEPED